MPNPSRPITQGVLDLFQLGVGLGPVEGQGRVVGVEQASLHGPSLLCGPPTTAELAAVPVEHDLLEGRPDHGDDRPDTGEQGADPDEIDVPGHSLFSSYRASTAEAWLMLFCTE